MSNNKGMASFKIIAEPEGNRYCFMCGITGACFYTKNTHCAETPEEEAVLAWEAEGKRPFNQCHKCGRWVVDAAFNPEVLECVACAAFEDEPEYCKFCGAKVTVHGRKCSVCGRSLYYEGAEADE